MNSAEICLSWSVSSGKGATLTVMPGNGTPTVPGRLSPEIKQNALHVQQYQGVCNAAPMYETQHAPFDTDTDNLIMSAVCVWQSIACTII